MNQWYVKGQSYITTLNLLDKKSVSAVKSSTGLRSMPARSPAMSPRDSMHRSPSPRSRSRSHKPSRSPSEIRSYRRGRTRSRSFTPEREPSRSPRRESGRWPRDRSYTRSPTPEGPKKSSKVKHSNPGKTRGQSTNEFIIILEENSGIVWALFANGAVFHRLWWRNWPRTWLKNTSTIFSGHLVKYKASICLWTRHVSVYLHTIWEVHADAHALVMTNRGTAYILYHDIVDAEAAVSNMHEAQVDGAVLKVSIVLPRRMFSRSPPPARRPAADDRSFSPRRHPPNHGRTTRVSPPRRRSPRRHINGGASERHDIYRPRSLSRSPSPRRSGARSYSARSDSASPPRRRSSPRRQSRHRRRRSPSYSSYSSRASSLSKRSRSPSRNRGQRSNNRYRWLFNAQTS